VSPGCRGPQLRSFWRRRVWNTDWFILPEKPKLENVRRVNTAVRVPVHHRLLFEALVQIDLGWLTAGARCCRPRVVLVCLQERFYVLRGLCFLVVLENEDRGANLCMPRTCMSGSKLLACMASLYIRACSLIWLA